MPPRWVPLESNPRALTSLAHKLGVPPSLAFTDILALDDWALDMLPRPVVAVLLLYPLTPALSAAHPSAPAPAEGEPPPLAPAADGAPAPGEAPWYLTQVVSNACGTIGILHAAANAPKAYGEEFAPAAGSFLATFMDRTAAMGAGARGDALEAEESLSDMHAIAAAEGETAAPPPEENVDTHFVAFVEHGGGVWECDGRKGRPVWRGSCAKGGLLEVRSGGPTRGRPVFG